MGDLKLAIASSLEETWSQMISSTMKAEMIRPTLTILTSTARFLTSNHLGTLLLQLIVDGHFIIKIATKSPARWETSTNEKKDAQGSTIPMSSTMVTGIAEMMTLEMLENSSLASKTNESLQARVSCWISKATIVVSRKN